jgi:cysteine desulfurase/selenocysteine lyase
LAWSLSELLLGEGDIILVSALEHHANFVPWQQAALRKGAELVLIPALEDGTLDMGFLNELDKDGRAARVKIAALAHISNAFGTVHPVRILAKWSRERDIPLVLDAAQSAPHLPLDAQATGADFLVFSGHKVFGPMGSGVLWGREEWLEKMPPWQTGGEMISSVKPEKSTWNELPYKFEAGTPDVAAAVGLAAALDWMSSHGVERLEARERDLESYAMRKLLEVEGLTLYGPRDPYRRRAVYSFNLAGIHSHDVAQYLDKVQVAIRSGHHCAQPAMRLMGIPSTARASLAPYNTTEDIDRLADAVRDVQEYFR